MRTFLLLISIALTIALQAQEENRKYWSDGPLTWSDFQERDTPEGISNLSYFIAYSTERTRINDTIFTGIVTYTYISTRSSWVDTDHKNDQLLRYNQVAFDLAEVHRRKLERKLNSGIQIQELDLKLQRAVEECQQEIEQLNAETNGGLRAGALAEWEEYAARRLRESKINGLPPFELKRFGMGVELGMGSGATTGTLSDHFTPAFGIMYGFDFIYQPFVLYLNGTLAWGKIRKEIQADDEWPDGKTANLAYLQAVLGYPIMESDKWKLTPFAGLGITEFTRQLNNEDEDDPRFYDIGPMAGLIFELKTRQSVRMVPTIFQSSPSFFESSLRARLGVMNADLDEGGNGLSFNFTLSYCWTFRNAQRTN